DVALHQMLAKNLELICKVGEDPLFMYECMTYVYKCLVSTLLKSQESKAVSTHSRPSIDGHRLCVDTA
ncbi:hypothetical protein M8J77_001180, partial [Diaphorina citri]